jgi:FkbM family methyltransferase
MIRIRAAGRSKPLRPLRWLAESAAQVSAFITIEVEVPTPEGVLRFRCPNAQTLRRAYTLFIKEPGTIAWLDEQLQPGDVFLDVGANMGVYTLYAAQRVGARGHVFAVEPHLRNAVALLDNVLANGLQERVSLLTVALCDAPGAARFDYREWRTGSSHSQLSLAGVEGKGIGELKIVQSIDALIEAETIRAPNLIKVDVDGIESLIVRGMARLLTGTQRPRSVQVECDPSNYQEIQRAMAQYGYCMRLRHATMSGAKHMAAGAQLTAIPHNAIFVPEV